MKLPDPLIEACAKAGLIEIRAQSIAGYARKISETPDPTALNPEEWAIFITSLAKLLEELQQDVDTFASKAQHGT